MYRVPLKGSSTRVPVTKSASGAPKAATIAAASSSNTHTAGGGVTTARYMAGEAATDAPTTTNQATVNARIFATVSARIGLHSRCSLQSVFTNISFDLKL